MAINGLKFNGVSTKELGLVIQAIPPFDIPEKDYEIIHVPGRNGDIVIDKGTYKNIVKKYNLAMIFTNEGNCVFPWANTALANSLKTSTDFRVRARAIAKWLLQAKGYCELEDDNDVIENEHYYRKAMIYNSMSIANALNQGSGFEVAFECKPQKYLVSGKVGQSFFGTGTIYSNIKYQSSPNIKLKPHRSSSQTKLNNITILLISNEITFLQIIIDPNGADITEVNIDWDTKTILDGNGNSIADRVTLKDKDNNIIYDFPEVPHDNDISIVVRKGSTTGNVNGTYTPNWWTIW